MTAVAPWGENAEDAFDQGLVELGLGDVRLIQAQGAMLPLGFEATPPRPLPMGSLVECHLATAYAWNGSSASAGVAWASCVTPEGDECAVVATISGDPLSVEAIHQQCDGNLARFKWPQQVVHTDALPRNSTGKVQKFVLRQEYA